MTLRLILAFALIAASSNDVAAAPFGFSKDSDVMKAPCVPGGNAEVPTLGAEAYTCQIPQAQPFFPKLIVIHLPATGVCRVHGFIAVEDTASGAATKKAFDQLARYIQGIEGEPILSVDRIRDESSGTHSKDWLSSIAENAREVRMQWLFQHEKRTDRLQKIQIDVGAGGDTTGKIAFTMSFGDSSCILLPPPPPQSPEPEYKIRIIPPVTPK